VVAKRRRIMIVFFAATEPKGGKKMDVTTALRQAHLTAAHYADAGLEYLKSMQDAHKLTPGSEAFAIVWAALINAAARDYDTTARTGRIERSPYEGKSSSS
jgi:hypothetical protein